MAAFVPADTPDADAAKYFLHSLLNPDISPLLAGHCVGQQGKRLPQYLLTPQTLTLQNPSLFFC
jgi:hypothetical protein